MKIPVFSRPGSVTSAAPEAVPSIQHKRVTAPAPTATLTPKQAAGKRQEDPGHRKKQHGSSTRGCSHWVSVRIQESPSHQWERLVLERQVQQGNECRPSLTDLFIPRAFVFLPQVFTSPHPSLKTKPSSHRTQDHGGGRKFPFHCQTRGYSHSPASLEGAFQAHVPNTETPKHLVIPACDCATTPTTPARVGKGKQQRQEAEITSKFKRPRFRQYFGF